MYIMINAFWQPREFRVQKPGPWFLAIDTAAASPNDIVEQGHELPHLGGTHLVQSRSIAVLIKK